LRNVASQILSLIENGQAHAVMDRTMYVLKWEEEKRKFVLALLKEGEGQSKFPGRFSVSPKMPQGYEVRLEPNPVQLFPDATVQEFNLVISNAKGLVITLSQKGEIEDVEVSGPQRLP
jgi:hypothetical protein